MEVLSGTQVFTKASAVAMCSDILLLNIALTVLLQSQQYSTSFEFHRGNEEEGLYSTPTKDLHGCQSSLSAPT